jgi:hypothetical protein
VSISSNGYVCLGTNTACGYITRPTYSNIIVGLNFDLNPKRSGSGNIFYQSLSLNSTFFQSACDLVNLLNADFMPTNIFMITYDDVYTYSGYSTAYLASFQIYLMANVLKSYVIFQYTSCLNGLSLRSSSGLNFYIASTSKQMSITNQCNSSNVNKTGIWVFEALGNIA